MTLNNQEALRLINAFRNEFSEDKMPIIKSIVFDFLDDEAKVQNFALPTSNRSANEIRRDVVWRI